MTPQQIFERLRDEFPDRQVSFGLEIISYRYSNGDGDSPNVAMNIRSFSGNEHISIPCASLEEGIAALKSRLGMGVPEMELMV